MEMTYGIIIAIISMVCIFLFVGVKNLLKQNEQLEDSYYEVRTDNIAIRNLIQRTLNTMKDIDSRGAFESDDEVGVVFEELKNAVEQLNQRIGANNVSKGEENNG